MKRLLQLLICSVIFLSEFSCVKDKKYETTNTARIQVINGNIGVQSVMLKMNGGLNTGFSLSTPVSKVNYGTGAIYYVKGESTVVDILKGVDTSMLVSSAYNFKGQGLYTLLVAGQLNNPETVLIEDTNFPYVSLGKTPSDADSVINVRFINLCPDTQPLDIRLPGASKNEASGLNYKGYTSFIAYPAKVTNYAGPTGYSVLSFEVVEGGTVLKTYSMFVYTPNRFKNLAIVITGMKTPGIGQPGLAVSALNYF